MIMDEYRQRFQQICELGEKRDDFLDGWLRWLVLLAAGCLSVVIPLSRNSDMSGIAFFLFRLTCILIGLGVVLLSIRIYGRHIGNKSLIKGLYSSMSALDNKPVVGSLPRWLVWFEYAGYLLLIFGMCSLIAFACVK